MTLGQTVAAARSVALAYMVYCGIALWISPFEHDWWTHPVTRLVALAALALSVHRATRWNSSDTSDVSGSTAHDTGAQLRGTDTIPAADRDGALAGDHVDAVPTDGAHKAGDADGEKRERECDNDVDGAHGPVESMDSFAYCMAHQIAAAPEHRHRRIALVTVGSLWRDGFDLCDWNQVRHVVVLRHWTLRRVRDAVADALCIAPHNVVMHRCARRRNYTVRPSALVPLERDGQDSVTFSDAKFASVGAIDACLLIEEGTSVVTADRPTLIIVKRFGREGTVLSRRILLGVDPTHTIDSVLPAIRKGLAIDPDATVSVFEEVRLGMVECVDPALTFCAANLNYGDILWVEVAAAADTPFVPPVPGSRMDQEQVRRLRVPAHLPLDR